MKTVLTSFETAFRSAPDPLPNAALMTAPLLTPPVAVGALPAVLVSQRLSSAATSARRVLSAPWGSFSRTVWPRPLADTVVGS